MIYLTGHWRDEYAAIAGLGMMLTQRIGYRRDLSGFPWAADNGCFRHPERFRLDRYVAWLETLRPYRATCLFVTAPDVLGDAQATVEWFWETREALWETGLPVALVAQDGMDDIPLPWEDFDCLFMGGSTAWKLSEPAYDLAREAQALGRWTHMGRVNSRPRYNAARVGGYDSADGTMLAFGPTENLPRVRSWLADHANQPVLPLPSRSLEIL